MKLTAWVRESAANLRVKPTTLWRTLYRQRLPWPAMIKKNRRVFDVLEPPLFPSCVPSGVMPRARASASPTLPAAPSITKTSTPAAMAS